MEAPGADVAATGVPGALGVTVRDGVPPSKVKASVSAALSGRHLSVLSGDQRGRAEDAGVAGSRLTLILLAAIFGGMALIVMAILLESIVSLSVEQRSRELGLLRICEQSLDALLAERGLFPSRARAAASVMAGATTPNDGYR